jgi:hypothetical protein
MGELLVVVAGARIFCASSAAVSARGVLALHQACLGVSAAHAIGLALRDIKPENLFLAVVVPDAAGTVESQERSSTNTRTSPVSGRRSPTGPPEPQHESLPFASVARPPQPRSLVAAATRPTATA